MSRKTVLVIGASGYFGSNLVQYLRRKHKVIAAFNQTILKFEGASHTMFSISDRDYMRRVFILMNPNVVIYAAGMTDFKECAMKPAIADNINGMGPIMVSSAGDLVPHRLIYLSSAYVYDGSKGNYSEFDPLFPGTQFGKSQAAAENFIRGKCSEYTLMRFSPLLGVGSVYHPSIFDKIRMSLQKEERTELAENEYHSFLSMEIACQAIDWVISNETKNSTYNLGGLTKVSWYEFGKQLAKKLGFDENLVVPGQSQFESGGDFSLNGSEIIQQSEINPLVLEETLDLFQKQLIL